MAEIEDRRRGCYRSLSAISGGITAQAVGLTLKPQEVAWAHVQAPYLAKAAADVKGLSVCGKLLVAGNVGCARDLYWLLSDRDLELADNHEKMIYLIDKCALALESMAGGMEDTEAMQLEAEADN